MNKLKVVRSLVDLNKIKNIVEGDKDLLLRIEKLEQEISEKYSISINEKEGTTPKKLYNKVYGELSREELNEYIQIKRILKRSQRRS